MRTTGFAVGMVAVAASMVLLLSGCAEARKAPPSGVTEAELGSYRDLVDEQTWLYSGLAADYVKPEVERVELDTSDWSEALSACELPIEAIAASDPEQALLVEYTCRAKFQLSAGSLALLNTAQLNYLYDYYQDTLIPCLGVRGITLERVPTRNEVVDVARFGSYPWHPFDQLFDYGLGMAAPDDLVADCPPYPPDGIFDRFRAQI